MKLWIDDIRTPPDLSWTWVKTVGEARIKTCQMVQPNKEVSIEIISLDHDAGDCAWNGGDYINYLKWLEERQYEWNIAPSGMPKFHIHSMNAVGRENMENIIRHNQWELISEI